MIKFICNCIKMNSDFNEIGKVRTKQGYGTFA